MIGKRSIHSLAALLALLLAAACTENEDDCYNRISADLDEARVLANQRGDRDYALAASESGVAASAIWVDDDRSICDYVTAGAYLERK